jgi:hypothetical protein
MTYRASGGFRTKDWDNVYKNIMPNQGCATLV